MTEGPGKIPLQKFKSAYEWHLYHVSNDPEFWKDSKTLHKKYYDDPIGNPSPAWAKETIALADKYGLTLDELGIVEYYWHGQDHIDERGWFIANTKNGQVEVSIKPNITKEEILKLWKEVKKYSKSNKTKKKPPQETELIYAVFKARKRGLSFREIFTLYSNNELPGYSKSPSQFKSEDSLERYFRKYGPKIDLDHPTRKEFERYANSDT